MLTYISDTSFIVDPASPIFESIFLHYCMLYIILPWPKIGKHHPGTSFVRVLYWLQTITRVQLEIDLRYTINMIELTYQCHSKQ